MRSLFGFILLAVATIVAAPAFAQTNNGPAGMWKGTVDRNGAQAPIVVRFAQKKGLWKGRADVDGSASPLTKVQVSGDHVRFTVKGQGTFDGTLAQDSLTGSIAASKKGKKGKTPGTFSLTRQVASNEEVQAAIDKVVESQGP